MRVIKIKTPVERSRRSTDRRGEDGMKGKAERWRLVGERRNQRRCAPSSALLHKSDNDLEVFTGGGGNHIQARSPGLFTGSKRGNNDHRFSPEEAKREKKMPRLIVTLHTAFVRGSAAFHSRRGSVVCCLGTVFNKGALLVLGLCLCTEDWERGIGLIAAG